MMASIGATNVQMAYVPLPEDSQQLQSMEFVMKVQKKWKKDEDLI